MQCGLFGKLPGKRDFIAVAVPRAFLAIWEPWLDAGLAESRAALGPDWTQAFFEAPIWRFFLGREICGTRVLGAIMPSVDAIGRGFPLTLVASAGPRDSLVDPAVAPRESWFGAVEDALLAALDPKIAFEATLDKLARLTEPAVRPDDGADLRYQAACDPDRALPLSRLFAPPATAVEKASFWWTRGGADFGPLAWSQPAMPMPHLFTSMLTGRFPASAPTP